MVLEGQTADVCVFITPMRGDAIAVALQPFVANISVNVR